MLWKFYTPGFFLRCFLDRKNQRIFENQFESLQKEFLKNVLMSVRIGVQIN